MKYKTLGLVCGLLAILGSATFTPAATGQGLVKEQPASGRFVKTDQGFMVPYKFIIPGTEAVVHMAPIPGGVVRVGSPESESGRKKVEGPQFDVVVEPFWMAAYETSWAEYKEFMNLYESFKEFETRGVRAVTDENRVDAITAPTELYDPSYTFDMGEHPRQQAITMTQYAAKQYTKWVTNVTGGIQFRLPSEAEWEHACRAGAETAYHFGDSPGKLSQYAWYGDNSNDTTQQVGKKKPNPWGLYDMHGNVSEWVLDELLKDGYTRFHGKRLTAAEAVVWPTKLFPRVVKGGSWDDEASSLRAAARLGSHDYDWKEDDPNIPLSPWWYTSDPAGGVGFRMIRPLKTTPKREFAKFWDVDCAEMRDDVTIRLEEGRGVIGLVDPDLPKALKELEK